MATDAQLCVTEPVRLSYANLFVPRKRDDDDEPEYSVMLIIPKSDTKTLARIRSAQKAALAAGAAKGTFGGTTAPKMWADTLHDADAEADLERSPELAGTYYMNVSSTTKPGIVDASVNPILDQTEVYSGCWARASIRAFAYNNKGKKGVSFYLRHIQKIRDAERLDGSTTAENDFEPWVSDEDESLI